MLASVNRDGDCWTLVRTILEVGRGMKVSVGRELQVDRSCDGAERKCQRLLEDGNSRCRDALSPSWKLPLCWTR